MRRTSASSATWSPSQWLAAQLERLRADEALHQPEHVGVGAALDLRQEAHLGRAQEGQLVDLRQAVGQELLVEVELAAANHVAIDVPADALGGFDALRVTRRRPAGGLSRGSHGCRGHHDVVLSWWSDRGSAVRESAARVRARSRVRAASPTTSRDDRVDLAAMKPRSRNVRASSARSVALIAAACRCRCQRSMQSLRGVRGLRSSRSARRASRDECGAIVGMRGRVHVRPFDERSGLCAGGRSTQRSTPRDRGGRDGRRAGRREGIATARRAARRSAAHARDRLSTTMRWTSSSSCEARPAGGSLARRHASCARRSPASSRIGCADRSDGEPRTRAPGVRIRLRPPPRASRRSRMTPANCSERTPAARRAPTPRESAVARSGEVAATQRQVPELELHPGRRPRGCRGLAQARARARA